MRIFKRFAHSLFLKLLLIYGATFLAIIIAVFCSFKTSSEFEGRDIFWKNLTFYLDVMTDKVGTPPDLQVAEELHSRTGLNFLIQGNGIDWTTQESMRELKLGRFKKDINGWSCGRRFAKRTIDGYTFTITAPSWRDEDKLIPMIQALVLILIILFFSYWATKWAFRSIPALKEGAEEFGRGNWDKRIPIKTSDELGNLADTLNGMAGRIQKQLQSMNELLIAISHELRSPLARMKVSLELSKDEKIKKSMAEEIDLLDRLTGDLLERERLIHRPDSLSLTEVDLRSFVEDVSQVYKNEKPGVKLDLPEKKVSHEIDVNRMAICLRNIIENAIQHNSEATEPIEISLNEKKEIIIRDHGSGIPQDVVENIGKPFYKADPSRTGNRKKGGFGLGLSLCHSIIKAHGGKLVVTSSDTGTEIKLILGN